MSADVPDISVCVATYRRPAGLARLLASLHRQKLPPGVAIEILVVDNDPASPATAPPGVRWLREPRRNIAHARNRGVEEARGAWLAFIDDDEEADEGWLAAYWSLARRGDADGFFGPVRSRSAQADKESSPLDLETFYARQRFPSGTLVDRSQVRTSNAFLRRALFAKREFDPAYGLSGGSDSALFGQMLDAGARFVFCDEAIVDEYVSADRRTLRWLSRRAFRGGVVSTRIARERDPATAWRSAPRTVAALALLAALLPVSALRGRTAAARVWLRLCIQVGHLWCLAGGSFVEYRTADHRD